MTATNRSTFSDVIRQPLIRTGRRAIVAASVGLAGQDLVYQAGREMLAAVRTACHCLGAFAPAERAMQKHSTPRSLGDEARAELAALIDLQMSLLGLAAGTLGGALVEQPKKLRGSCGGPAPQTAVICPVRRGPLGSVDPVRFVAILREGR